MLIDLLIFRSGMARQSSDRPADFKARPRDFIEIPHLQAANGQPDPQAVLRQAMACPSALC